MSDATSQEARDAATKILLDTANLSDHRVELWTKDGQTAHVVVRKQTETIEVSYELLTQMLRGLGWELTS